MSAGGGEAARGVIEKEMKISWRKWRNGEMAYRRKRIGDRKWRRRKISKGSIWQSIMWRQQTACGKAAINGGGVIENREIGAAGIVAKGGCWRVAGVARRKRIENRRRSETAAAMARRIRRQASLAAMAIGSEKAQLSCVIA
jgi:hypothetical protein